MVLFSALKLIQDGFVNMDDYSLNMLKSSKFYFLPALNVDGVAFIEASHNEGGKMNTITDKRKNMGPAGTAGEDGKGSCFMVHVDGKETEKCYDCNGKNQGVDLNRNYGVDWKVNLAQGAARDPCSELYPGPEPFSEKETQAMKNFLESKKGELSFVINFHSNGNSFMWPFNGRNPNDIETRAPGVLAVVKDITENANFPENLSKGNSW